MIKKYVVFLLLFVVIFFCCGYKKLPKFEIDAGRNANYHNDLALSYLRDRIYYAAIQEFKIAISLSSTAQASAVYYNNLGETYNFIGYPEQAMSCFEEAVRLYGMNLKYYINLIQSYIVIGCQNSKESELKNSNDIFDRIKLGILYVESDRKIVGINILDEVCNTEPNLIIIPALRQYIKQAVK